MLDNKQTSAGYLDAITSSEVIKNEVKSSITDHFHPYCHLEKISSGILHC